MRKRIFSLVAGLVLGGAAFAATGGGEECTKAKTEACTKSETVASECSATECPTAKKVTSLLARWEAAAEEARTATPEAREKFGAKVASVAEKCPVGSKMGETFAAVRDTLGLLVASQEASAENCPLEKTEAGAYAEAKQMKAYRAEALNGLHKLASYAAGGGCAEAAAACGAEKTAAACGAEKAAAACGAEKAAAACGAEKAAAASCADVADACCASEGAAAVATAGSKADCGEKDAASCTDSMAKRLATLKASFVEARGQVESMSTEARGEILAGFASLGEENPAIALVPETVGALAEGLAALDGLHTKMGEWAQAHPEMMSDLPESAHRAFMAEVSLVKEASALLQNVSAAMQAMHSKETKTAMAR